MKSKIVIFEANKLDGKMSKNPKFYPKNTTEKDKKYIKSWCKKYSKPRKELLRMKIGSDYWLYMAEAEGLSNLVDTREAILNRMGKELCKMGYKGQVVPPEVFADVVNRYGQRKVTLDNVTSNDIRKIERWL